MSIIVKKFSTGTSVIWNWPLQVFIDTEDEGARNEFVSGYWSSKFVDLWIPEKRKNYPPAPSLVVIPLGHSQFLEDLLEDNEGQIEIEFTAIFLIERDINDWLNRPLRDQDAERLVKLFNARGLFIIQHTGDIAKWFDDLVVELSHNFSLPEALTRTTSAGYFYYDKALDTEAKISMLIPDLVEFLEKHNSILPSFINPWDRTLNMEGKQMADFILKYEKEFMYHSESGEAEKIAELNRMVYKIEAISVPRQGTGGMVEYFEKYQRDVMYQTAPNIQDPDFTAGAATEDADGDGGGNWKMSDKPDQPDPDTPRFLQAGIFDQANVLQEELLLTNQFYSIAIGIGYPKKDRLRGAQAVPVNDIFDQPDQKEEPIRIVFSTNINDASQAGDILLPRIGNSTEVNFLFRTPATAGEFKAEITAYHKNRPIQKALITGYIATQGQANASQLPGITMDIVETYRKNLDRLADRSTFSTSIELSENVHGNLSFRGISDNQPIELNFSTALEKLIKEIKNLIEETVINIDQYPENLRDANVTRLLINLALKGNSLFFDYFRKQQVAEGPIKIISSKAEFIPLDFMYTKPPPLQNAVLCEHAEKALEQGACQGCKGIEQDPSPVICPLGFWCFSKVVERSGKRGKAPGSGDYSVHTEPGAGRDTIDILNNTLFASSEKVYAALPDLKKNLLDAIRLHSRAMQEVPDWDSWRQEMGSGKGVDCLILLVHIEKDKVSGQDSVEIGNGKFQLINYFNEKMVIPAGATKPPLIILLGCESTNIGHVEFDLSSRFLNSGAGIVLSSFTKIRGRQAGPIVMKLIEFIKLNASQSITLGEVLLKLRQRLLAKGILSGLSLVSYGDADWKIKS